MRINGTTTAAAFASWFSAIGTNAPQAEFVQCENCYPCKSCCSTEPPPLTSPGSRSE
jgi:hypothetical protein